MKTAIITFFIFVIVNLSSNIQYSQTRNLNHRVKERKQTEERNTNKNDKQPGRTRNDESINDEIPKRKKENPRIEETKISNPVKSNRPIIKPQKPIYIEEIIEIPVETFIVETPENKKFTIDDVYPNFPLRFIEAEISYIYSVKNEDDEKYTDFYELNFSIKPKTDSYFSQFGIQIFSSNDYEYIQIFNEDENTLFQDSTYNFVSEIELEKSGYVNLRIGFYDKIEEIFYPAIEIPNKTDFLIFVKNVDEKILLEELI
ncbi:MAG: hypothetical protein IPM32_14520 [Ignavibacteriae bacterium]|nr:hypothetical protein [Ignavibacteriota bacterium]